MQLKHLRQAHLLLLMLSNIIENSLMPQILNSFICITFTESHGNNSGDTRIILQALDAQCVKLIAVEGCIVL